MVRFLHSPICLLCIFFFGSFHINYLCERVGKCCMFIIKEPFWSSMPEVLPCDYCMKKWEMYLKNTVFQYIIDAVWEQETLVNSCCRVCIMCLNMIITKEAAGAILPPFILLLSVFSVLLCFVAAEPLVRSCRFSHVHRQQCCFFMINSFRPGPKQQNIPCSSKQSYLSSYLRQHGKLYVFWRGRKSTFQKKIFYFMATCNIFHKKLANFCICRGSIFSLV